MHPKTWTICSACGPAGFYEKHTQRTPRHFHADGSPTQQGQPHSSGHAQKYCTTCDQQILGTHHMLVSSDTSALKNITAEAAKAILANTNIKLIGNFAQS